jgi:hypothetical protein
MGIVPRQPVEWGNGLCAKRDANVDVDPPTFALSQPVVRAITVTAIAPPPRNGSASGRSRGGGISADEGGDDQARVDDQRGENFVEKRRTGTFSAHGVDVGFTE